MNAITPIEARRERLPVFDAVPVLDTGRFEQMQRIATIMARSPLVPRSLRFEEVNKEWLPLPWEEALANCFLVTNQAVRWTLDPFAVAQCCSVVHGRLMYEGKLVAAVIDAKLGEQLTFEWNSANGDAFGIRIEGSPDARGKPRIIEGTVGDWKTSGSNSPWKPSVYRKMLAYRGIREWTRLYEPAVLLGVYTPDEMEDLQEVARSDRARPAGGPPRQVRQSVPAAIENKTETTKAATAHAKPEPVMNLEAGTLGGAQLTGSDEPDEHQQLEEIVAQFVRQSEEATNRALLDEAEALVEPYQNENKFGLSHRTTIANAWEAADDRLTKAERAHADHEAEAGRAVKQADELAGRQQPVIKAAAPTVDTSHPAYMRGLSDCQRGVKKCLKPEYREDPALLALWEAGFNAGT